MIEKEFEKYTKEIIRLTFGFEPQVTAIFPSDTTVQLNLDGSERERRLMMGREGNNLRAIKGLLRVFSKTNNRFCYLYIIPNL